MQGLADAVERLIGRSLRADERVAVAVSGGPDSLALLLLAAEAFGSRTVALTVDHDLRAGSADEAAMVAEVCSRLGVEHVTLRWTGPKPRANIQAEARQARYALMSDWCAANGVAWLLTGHHADDQAETLLMRLARGSGSGGLAGIRATRALGQGVTLLRPLLGERHASLAAVVAKAGLTPVDDPANRDPRHDRTAARAALAAAPWLEPERLAAAADHLAEAEAALAWAAGLAWDSRVDIGSGSVVVDAAGLPEELRRRLVARAFANFDEAPDGPRLERLIERLATGGTATLGSVQGRGGTKWTFSRVAPRVKPQ